MLRDSLAESIDWHIKPSTPLRSATRAKRDWIVWADNNELPRSTFLPLTASSSMAMRCEFERHPLGSRTFFWQKFADNIAADTQAESDNQGVWEEASNDDDDDDDDMQHHWYNFPWRRRGT